jgi:MFS family permease
MGSVLSAYIFFLADESHKLLGLTAAATGFAMTLVIFPSGFFADKYRRDYLLKIAALIGLFALGYAFVADTLMKLLVVLILWGLFQGLTRPSLEAIFADSVVTGDRSRIYSLKHSVQQISMASGPFVNVGLFYYFGDEWELEILKSVLFVGLIISILSLFTLLVFNDEKSMGEASESLPEVTVQTNDDKNITKSTKIIPYFLIGSNLVIGFGAGMTIRFFPIFFLEAYDLKPISVNFIMGVTAIFTGIASLFAQRFSLYKGRAQTIFIVQITATACLFAIAFYPPLILLFILFVARGSLMNAAQPLSRSILMDTVPKQHRGKINALEGIVWGLFWNVSAVAGGYLIAFYDYQFTFLITASVYTVGSSLILFIVPLVSKEKGSFEEVGITPTLPIIDNFTSSKGK